MIGGEGRGVCPSIVIFDNVFLFTGACGIYLFLTLRTTYPHADERLKHVLLTGILPTPQLGLSRRPPPHPLFLRDYRTPTAYPAPCTEAPSERAGDVTTIPAPAVSK